MMDDLKALCQGEEGDGRRQIFTIKPHSTWNNFFSGDDINEWIGHNGFGVTMTCCRDQLPRGVPNHFLHKGAMAPGDKKARVARFNNPISVVKHAVLTPPAVLRTTEGKNALLPTMPANPPINYTQVHVTLQSTSLCNITTVNVLNQNAWFIVQKERGIRSRRKRGPLK